MRGEKWPQRKVAATGYRTHKLHITNQICHGLALCFEFSPVGKPLNNEWCCKGIAVKTLTHSHTMTPFDAPG